MSNRLGDGWSTAPGTWIGRYAPASGLISFVVNEDDEDWHIDARPGYSAAEMRTTLAEVRAHGMEPLDADECEPEILEDGTIRIYLAHIEQPVVAVDLQEERRTSAAKRVTLAFTLTACVAGALLAPSPLRFDYIPSPRGGQSDTADPVVTNPGTKILTPASAKREEP